MALRIFILLTAVKKYWNLISMFPSAETNWMLWLIKVKLLHTASYIICHAGTGTALVRDGNLVRLETIHLMKLMNTLSREDETWSFISYCFMIYLKSRDTLKYKDLITDMLSLPCFSHFKNVHMIIHTEALCRVEQLYFLFSMNRIFARKRVQSSSNTFRGGKHAHLEPGWPI